MLSIHLPRQNMLDTLTNSKKLIDVLACPRCKSSLNSTNKCDNCGLEFTDDSGTPQLFDPQFHRTVQFEFSADRTVIEEEKLQKYFNYPPTIEVNDKLPYHLEPAQFKIINELPPSQKILEIGCGGGQMREWFAQKGHQYIGVDISKTRVFEWLQKFGGPDILCDAHSLPFQDNQLDLIYSAAVTEHLACPHLVVQEIARVLKPGGYYLGNVSFLEPWHDNSFFHMSPLGAIELLTQAGFQIQYVWPEKGYSAFRSVFAMGNGITNNIRFIGDIGYLAYLLENNVKNVARKILKRSEKRNINQAAKVSGAIFWIATLPR